MECTVVQLYLLKKLQISSKILHFSENEEIIKFSSRILPRSVIFTEKLQILMKMIKFDLFSVNWYIF